MRSWVAVVLCASVTGCVVYKDPGSTHGGPSGDGDGQVQVNWLVGSAGCDSAEVATVEVTIGTDTEDFACGDGTATLTVPSGSYDVALQGLDADGVARYAGDGGVVDVYGGQTSTVPTVVMSALPATLTTIWYFKNSHLCAANGVSDVEINVFDAEDVLKGTATVACDDGTATLTDLEAGGYAVLALGRDAAGQEIYSGSKQIDLARGDDAQIEIPLVAE